MISRECPQKSVKSPVHQQDKYGSSGSGQGGVKGLGNLYWKTWDCEAREELSDENIILKDDNGLGEGRVVVMLGPGRDECRLES